MTMAVSRAHLTTVRPALAIEDGRVTIDGVGFPVDGPGLPEVRIGGVAARVVLASSSALGVLVPEGLEPGRVPVEVDAAPGEQAFIEVAAPLVREIHQVDNPVFDRSGNLYVTSSGARGERVPVSIFRVRPTGIRESFVTGIVNATSMIVGGDGNLYVSSRFDGAVYRIDPTGQVTTLATDLGIACGLAFASDGSLFVGDRSGTIFRLAQDGQATVFASVPPSVAAFHLAMGPDEHLYVSAPTMATCDAIHRIDPGGRVEVFYSGFGRPQGLAFDARGALHVVEALAGASGVYRFRPDGTPEQILAGPGLVGIAIDPIFGMAVASNDTLYRLPART
jgi:sugar lactone lactonase YvrE